MAAATKKTARKTAKAAETTANETFATFETIQDAARDQMETMMNAFNEKAETFRDQAEDVMETYREHFAKNQERAREFGAEFVNAAREETSDAVEFVNELARAKSVGDAFEIQRNYWTNLFETRTQRASDMTKASVEAAREVYEPFQKAMTAFTPAGFEKIFPFSAK